MIAMINFISGSNILPETLFKLFAPLKTYDSFEMHFYCAKCRNTHTSEDNRDTKMVCCDTICTNYFITFDMKEKIEKFLTVNASNIKCTRSNDNIIRDIFDGEVYKELSKTGFDPEKDLTFNFSLDGAPLSKSSTLQAWPIFITINEIDLKFRFKNIFTAGFWISSSQMTNDLNIKNLLTVFVNRMKILQNTGVTYKNDKITKISRIFPLYCVADAPAKAKILNFINHSGYYSCNYCEIHGIYESNAVRFPYGNNVQLRTKKEWQKCARIAMNTNKAVKGIKGSTPLTDLQGFNIIWGAPPDYMHIILLGVMRTLFELYFTNTGNPWYIGSPKQRSLLDKKLFEIKVPNYINRKPRSVSKWKFWKATEFGNFLYYYIFILENILPVEYYKHILHLRAGLMLLLKRAVAKDDVIKANEHFHNFVCYFEILFGVQYSTFNIHMLLHLSQSVKKCGPLWGFSAFPFENNLRIFRTLITGSKIPTKQVVKKVKVIQFLNMISHENINNEVLKFCEINYNVGYSISKLDRPLKVGKPLEVTFPWDNYTEAEALAIQSLNISNKIILYGNIKFSHFTVDTKNNNTLFLVDGKVGRVTKIFKNSESLYLLFQEYKVAMDYSGTVWKLINTTPANSNEECLKVIEPNLVKLPCIIMSNLFAYVQFLDDKSRNVVPVKDIKHFDPKTLEDFSKKKIFKIYWPQEDDQANLEKYERSIYEGTILDLGASKESFLKQKRIASVPFSMLESPSETELDDPSSKILSMGNALPQAKTIDLLQTMKKNLTQTSKISSDSEYSSDGEVYLPKRKVYEYENKIINQKKKIKTLQNEMEVLKSRNAYLETDYDTLKEKLNRYESNAGIEESSCKEMLKVLLQETTEIKASLKTTLEGIFLMIYINKYNPLQETKIKEMEIIFGSISFPEKPFLTISRRPKHSLFVKDLVSLLWSDEDLSQRSLTGKKHYNSKEIKQPLTPEKRFAIEEAFKDRLKKQQYHDAMIALELKLVNRYIA
ncbi:hypothetical protein Avbf_17945 [Armadillidium vulgare]|nr:hypothetical protein Avbf_17945 [Armadillidium vulgare]